MYNFKKFEKVPNGRKSIKAISVCNNKVILYKGYMKDYTGSLYCELWYDSSQNAIGLKPTIQQKGFLIYGKTEHSRRIMSASFQNIPDGVYNFKERTNEGIDVFTFKSV